MAKNHTHHPAHVIEKFVLRHFVGKEPVVRLAREADVARPTFYNWLRAFKEDRLKQEMRAGMTPDAVLESERIDLVIENAALKRENAMLREKIVAMVMSDSSPPRSPFTQRAYPRTPVRTSPDLDRGVRVATGQDSVLDGRG